MLVIPGIDLKDGKCVRLRQGRMDEVTVFSDDPIEVARHWVAVGARRLHVVDLDGGGTSAAAAHVAGLAALLIASGKSNSEAASQIKGATDPISGQSFGRINVAKALGAPVPTTPTPTPSGWCSGT